MCDIGAQVPETLGVLKLAVHGFCLILSTGQCYKFCEKGNLNYRKVSGDLNEMVETTCVWSAASAFARVARYPCFSKTC